MTNETDTIICPVCKGRGYFIGEPKEYDKGLVRTWEAEFYNSLCVQVREKRYECWCCRAARVIYAFRAKFLGVQTL